MTCGIYLLEFLGTDKVYIGQSSNIERRYKEHLRYLRADDSTKESIKIREAYQKYGDPLLQILSTASISDLNLLEEQYIIEFDAVNTGLNTASGPMCNLHGEDHYNSKYSNEVVLSILEYLIQEPMVDFTTISTSIGVSNTLVESIHIGRTHTWLQDAYPDKYSKLLQLKPIRSKFKHTVASRGKVYPPIISPTGISYIVYSAKEFATEHFLNHSHLVGVLNGKRKTHKGWKLAE